MRTVVDAIVDNVGGTGTLTMLGAGAGTDEVVPWRVVHEHARRMSSVLLRCGLGPGCRVGLLGETSVELVTALQAVWLTGGAVTVMPPAGRQGQRGHQDYIAAVVADAGLDLILVDGELAGTGFASSIPVVSLDALVRQARTVAPAVPHRPDPTDLAVLQYTSGSTRAPRGVPVSHGHLAANLDAIKVALDHDASHPSRMLSWLPLYHDMGLIAFLTLPMVCGCPLVLQPPLAFARRPASWLQALSRHRITMSGAPNFAYALMTRLLGTNLDIDLSSVRCLVSGGEPIDAPMMAKFAAAARPFGLDPSVLLPAYGLAETTLAATVSPVFHGLQDDWIDPAILEAQGQAVPADPDRGGRQLVRVGRPVMGTSVRIVDRDTGEPVDDRIVGHIELRGPSVIGHYWGDSPPAAGSWLRTGDLGYLADGDLVVCGREKDVLFAAGRNVFPQDIEVIATEVPGVRSGGAVAFGIPYERGDRLIVAVEARSTDAASVGRAVAAAVLAESGLAPADVVVVPHGRLPKTTSGKLRRAEARHQYLAGRLGSRAEPDGQAALTRHRVLEMEPR